MSSSSADLFSAAKVGRTFTHTVSGEVGLSIAVTPDNPDIRQALFVLCTDADVLVQQRLRDNDTYDPQFLLPANMYWPVLIDFAKDNVFSFNISSASTINVAFTCISHVGEAFSAAAP